MKDQSFKHYQTHGKKKIKERLNESNQQLLQPKLKI